MLPRGSIITGGLMSQGKPLAASSVAALPVITLAISPRIESTHRIEIGQEKKICPERNRSRNDRRYHLASEHRRFGKGPVEQKLKPREEREVRIEPRKPEPGPRTNSRDMLPVSTTMAASSHIRWCELLVAVRLTVITGITRAEANSRGVMVRIRPVNCAAVKNQKTGTVVMPTYWIGTSSSLSSSRSSRTSIP